MRSFPSLKPLRWTQRQWVRVWWSEDCFFFRWRCQSRHLRTSTSLQRSQRGQTNRQQHFRKPTFTKQKPWKSSTTSAMQFFTSNRSSEQMTTIIWPVLPFTRFQKSKSSRKTFMRPITISSEPLISSSGKKNWLPTRCSLKVLYFWWSAKPKQP